MTAPFQSEMGSYIARLDDDPGPEVYTGTDAPRDMFVEEFDGIDVLAVG